MRSTLDPALARDPTAGLARCDTQFVWAIRFRCNYIEVIESARILSTSADYRATCPGIPRGVYERTTFDALQELVSTRSRTVLGHRR